MLLAIDPGADTGWAVYDSCRRLTACGLYDGDRNITLPSVEPGARVLIECPRLRPRGEKNPNSILLVARKAGEWAGRFHHHAVEYLLPNDWKGTTDKKIDHPRTWARLDDKERAIVDAYFRSAHGRQGLAPSRRHNVLDALGIGLFGVGRGVRT
jgi:hypothetical protein